MSWIVQDLMLLTQLVNGVDLPIMRVWIIEK
jgi:hypothetical protein